MCKLEKGVRNCERTYIKSKPKMKEVESITKETQKKRIKIKRSS